MSELSSRLQSSPATVAAGTANTSSSLGRTGIVLQSADGMLFELPKECVPISQVLHSFIEDSDVNGEIGKGQSPFVLLALAN